MNEQRAHKIRDLTRLASYKNGIFIVLPTTEIADRFIEDVVAQGVVFHDGTPASKRERLTTYRLSPDGSLSYLGYIGHVQLYGSRNVWKIDYGKFLHGAYDEMLQNPVPFSFEEFSVLVYQTASQYPNYKTPQPDRTYPTLQAFLRSDEAQGELLAHYNGGLTAYQAGRISENVFRTVTVTAVANCLSMTYYNNFLKNEVQ